MRRIDRKTAIFCLAACAVATVVVVNYPWFSFLSTILVWTAMRAPKDFGFGHVFKIVPAKSISEAAYEGLWAAVAIVFGVTIVFDSVKAVV